MSCLRTNNISLYAGARWLCAELNLHINPGDFWGVLGPNGSGKTTLLHTLAGLHAPQYGDVLLNDKPLTQLAAKHIAQSIGILFQDLPPAFPLRVLDYCAMARYPHLSAFTTESLEDKRMTQEALQAMELTALQQRLLTSLSGGEKQRVYIAALLTQSPFIYLLDEPTNHLDIGYQAHVMHYFQRLAQQQRAIVASLHDINLAQHYCNRILLLFPDGSTCQGTPAQVLNEANLQRLYQCPVTRQGVMWSPYVMMR